MEFGVLVKYPAQIVAESAYTLLLFALGTDAANASDGPAGIIGVGTLESGQMSRD